MIKALMVGGGFRHQTTVSINNKESDKFKWVFDESHDIKIFIDESIIDNLGKPKDNNYAWIFESRAIFNRDFLYRNYEILSDSYEMIFTHDEELLKLGRNFVFIPANSFWINNPEIKKKTKLVSFIASSKNLTVGHKKRLEVLKNIPSYVDVFGFSINPISKKEEGLDDYMFSICIENDKYNYYFTEKILDCFATGTIPIYWGCSSIDKFFNKEGVIEFIENFDFGVLTEELYFSKINYIQENLQKVKKMEILEDTVFNLIYEKHKETKQL